VSNNDVWFFNSCSRGCFDTETHSKVNYRSIGAISRETFIGFKFLCKILLTYAYFIRISKLKLCRTNAFKYRFKDYYLYNTVFVRITIFWSANDQISENQKYEFLYCVMKSYLKIFERLSNWHKSKLRIELSIFISDTFYFVAHTIIRRQNNYSS
jgi:hypothetical protein